MKICYCLRIDQSQSKIHIFIPGDVLIGPIKIVDNNDLKYVMVVPRSLRGTTKLYVTESLIEGRENQQAIEIMRKKGRII